MAGISRHRIGLSGMFLKYLLSLVLGMIVLVIGYLLSINIGFKLGIFLPANYAEHQIAQNKEAIKSSAPFNEALIPKTCQYGLFDEKKRYIQGSFDDETLEDVKLFLSHLGTYQKRYILIERTNESCVIEYDVQMHFASLRWHHWFPNVELFLVVVLVGLNLSWVIAIAMLFAKRLKKELAPVMEATRKIQEKDLDFKLQSSKIKEFNEIVESLDTMKEALANSLKNEWETERRRKEHISILAHDIKTPLTVIKGNAELLKEESENSELLEYAESIDQSSYQIENYIKLLIDATKDEENISLRKQDFSLEKWIEQVEEECSRLCMSYQVTLEKRFEIKSKSYKGDRESLLRVVLNLVKNGLEQTMDTKKLILRIMERDEKLIIEVEDFGKGFSEEALQKGTNQFFTENKARTGTHYGLGLYMSQKVVKGHEGQLSFENKKAGQGAIVSITLPLK